jgi:hypothetical protein
MGTSADEGRVEDELNRADEELSYNPAVEVEWLVATLPLECVSLPTSSELAQHITIHIPILG